jgi:hypothetical protein
VVVVVFAEVCRQSLAFRLVACRRRLCRVIDDLVVCAVK